MKITNVNINKNVFSTNEKMKITFEIEFEYEFPFDFMFDLKPKKNKRTTFQSELKE